MERESEQTKTEPVAPEIQVVRATDRLKKALWAAGYSNRTERGYLAELRSEQRLELESRGMCTVPGRFSGEPIDVKDLSLSGLQFWIKQPLARGDQCQLVICLPGVAPCRVLVIVCWVAPVRDSVEGLHRVGARIVEAPPRSNP